MIARGFVVFVLTAITVSAYDAKNRPSPNAVTVKVINKALPRQESRREEFLWNNIASRPENEEFRSYPAKGWRNNFALFERALVQKADQEKLDSTSLRAALEMVLRDAGNKIAYLPVGAYQTTLNRDPVWIIAVKWEYASTERNVGLMHIRVFAFHQKTLKRIGFVTCG